MSSPEVIKGVSFFTAFFIISYLHIVVGELAPKSWAIRKPETLSLWTAVPLYLFYWAMYLPGAGSPEPELFRPA